MYRIYLAQVVDNYGPNKFLPLALGYLWSYAKNDRWQLQDVLIEKIPPQDYVNSLISPDMMVLSSYVWNWEYHKKVAKLTKEKFPECVIVTGGPQIAKNNNNFFAEYPMFDVVVHGEGEQAFKEILLRPKGDYDNIINTQTRTYFPEITQRLSNLNSIPSPILEGFYNFIMEKYPKDTLWQVTYETMRGCPYRCAFCDIGDLYWNKITTFDTERIKKEIDWMSENKIEYVSVCDSNWGLLDRDLELNRYVIEKKLATGYPKFWDVTWAKNNVERNFEMALMNKQAGTNLYKGVTFAIQSLHEPTLKSSKRFNLVESKISKYLTLYKKEKIPTYSELIWPLPEETYSSLKSNIQKLIDLGQDDFLMIHPLNITFNADMANPEFLSKHGLKTKLLPLDTYYLSTKDLKDYIIEYVDIVTATNTADESQVIKGNMFVWLLVLMYYYGWAHYIAKSMKKKGIKETDFFDSMLNWILKNPDTLLYKEYKETLDHITNTFNKGQLWGRKVLGDYDILWEYKSASSIIMHDNINNLRKDLISFLQDTFPDNGIDNLVDLNLALCNQKGRQYPVHVNVDKSLAKEVLNIDSETLCIWHDDLHQPKDDMWYHKSYHWQRKNSYWRCNVKGI